DLGDVRLHSDAAAAEALIAAKALALAAGNHIVIAPGFASPVQGLLVHEVVHVLQQRHGRRAMPALKVQQAPLLEREPEEAARSFQGFLRPGAQRPTLSVTPSEVALAYAPFPHLCLKTCPLRVVSRFPPTQCLLTDCADLGFFPPVFAKSWCVYLCPGGP